MTRDHIAALVLAGIATRESSVAPVAQARRAVVLADALLTELSTASPAPGPESAPVADHASAIERFEEAAREVGLEGYGMTVLLRDFDPEARRPADLTDADLEAAAIALDSDETAAEINARGFAEQASARIRRAPERKRPAIHEAALEAAGGLFGGERLASVRLALDKAAGLPVGPDAA